MVELLSRLRPQLSDDAADWLSSARDRVAREGAGCIPELFPQLPRRIGRDPLGGGKQRLENLELNLDAWRACDAAAAILLLRPAAPDGTEVDLFLHGDLEERSMVMRCLGVLPIKPATAQLLGEAQRTNTVTHFEAAVCDSNLAARALRREVITLDEFNRLMLKVAFLEIDLERVYGVLEYGNVELSRMLQGLATEREAAGRGVWVGTNYLIARAPAPGTIARLVGHLEHGDDRHRLAAADGLRQLRRPELAPLVQERLEREPREEIRTVLERTLSETT